MTGFDARSLRNAFGSFMTGVTVVTSVSPDGKPIGFTANSFASVSLDPPLLLVCLARSSRNFDNVTGAGHFAVNILAEDQKDVSNTFARPSEDRFAGLGWQTGICGSPVLDGVAAWFECRTHEIVDAGDHVILIGRVHAFDNHERSGLGYARGAYFFPSLAEQAASAFATQGPVMSRAIIEHQGGVLLSQTADARHDFPGGIFSGSDWLSDFEACLEAFAGTAITLGYLYSVYTDRASGQRHVVYRATANTMPPVSSIFVDAGALPELAFVDAATTEMARRYATERLLGNFGIYVGNETSGQVHALNRKNTP